ncbi:MAG: dockerin type I repeat-containing protein [Clostridia bacterium]|nr:dockerin type I repeat-containing protein [Clostridia bacterium]
MKKRAVLSVLLTLALLVPLALPAAAKLYSLGDVTGDGKITSADARAILRYAAKIERFSEAQEAAADINRSGKVNSGDARTALRVAARLETLTVGADEVFDDGRKEHADDPDNDRAVDDFIDILNSGNFVLAGEMTSEGETLPVTFMQADGNVRMSAEISGIAMDMAQLDGKTYLICTGKKSYAECTDYFMSMMGIDPSDLDLEIGTVDVECELDWTEREYGGKTVECAVTVSDEGILEFYIDGGNVVLIRMLDPESGVCNTEIGIDEFRGGVTAADLAIPADYTKKGYVEFIADLADEWGDGSGNEPYDPWPVGTELDLTDAEILARYNEVMNNTRRQVKTFVKDEWTEYDYIDAGASTALFGSVLDALRTDDMYSVGVFCDDPALIPPANSAGVGCALTDADAISEAHIIEYDDGTAEIEIVLKNERDPEPMDPQTGVSPSFTGAMFDVVSRDETETSIREKTKSIPGLSVSGVDTEYFDCTVYCTYDIGTGCATDLWFVTYMHAAAAAKLIVPMTVRVDMTHSVALRNMDYA